MDFQRIIIQNLANRIANVLRDIQRYRQRDGQTVREVLDELTKLRGDIPPLVDEERRTQELLFTIRLEIRTKVQRELPQIISEN